MTFGCAAVRELAPDLALGVVGGAERAELLLHVNACPHCQSLVAELSETADLLMLLAPEAEPSPGFTRRVLAEMGVGRRRLPWRSIAAAVAAAAAASILSIAVVRIVDEGVPAKTSVASAPRFDSAAMVGSGDRNAGTVFVSHSNPASINVSVDYAVPDGTYEVHLVQGSTSRVLGSMTVSENHGVWSGTISGNRLAAAHVALVDANGTRVCEGVLKS